MKMFIIALTMFLPMGLIAQPMPPQGMQGPGLGMQEPEQKMHQKGKKLAKIKALFEKHGVGDKAEEVFQNLKQRKIEKKLKHLGEAMEAANISKEKIAEVLKDAKAEKMKKLQAKLGGGVPEEKAPPPEKDAVAPAEEGGGEEMQDEGPQLPQQP